MTTRREAIDKEIAEAKAKITKLETEKENLSIVILNCRSIQDFRDRTLVVKINGGTGVPDEVRLEWPFGPSTGARYIRA